MKVPPLAIDEPLAQMIEAYRVAKTRAATAVRQRTPAETGGHYDSDMPMSQRAVAEPEEVLAERLAAIRLADELLAWVSKHST
jgi:hypothetical protein